jgi:alkaline phosphatase D
MRELIFTLFAALSATIANSQKNKWIVAGPMPAHTELRTAKVWVEFQKNVTSASIFFIEKDRKGNKQLAERLQLKGGEFNTALFTLTALEPGRTYKYYITANNERQFSDSGEVTTQKLWQWRTSPPDFSFITGSCAYFNEPPYDRPGEPYGEDSSIFTHMTGEKSDFMLWLGDNWYAREVDYFSDWGLYHRAGRDRSLPLLQQFLKSMPHYAIWDDHDYGPNDANKSYVLKNTARRVFKDYWGNPSYGMNEQGVYTQFTWNDVEFYLLDNRWFRSSDKLPDSISGGINKEKKMLGDEQMEWLKNALVQRSSDTSISFRFIVCGSQVLNTLTPYNCMWHYRAEYDELLKFIADNKIPGVIFLTGDRHHSEIIKTERSGAYPLYDITVSPLTSRGHEAKGAELNNPFRVSREIVAHNYGRISFSGTGENRKLTIDFKGVNGNTITSWSVMAKNIAYPRDTPGPVH